MNLISLRISYVRAHENAIFIYIILVVANTCRYKQNLHSLRYSPFFPISQQVDYGELVALISTVMLSTVKNGLFRERSQMPAKF